MVLRKMKDIDTLDENVCRDFVEAMKTENEVLTNSFLNVIENQALIHDFMQDYLIALLKHNSQFISKRAYQMLEEMKNKPEHVKNALKKWE